MMSDDREENFEIANRILNNPDCDCPVDAPEPGCPSCEMLPEIVIELDKKDEKIDRLTAELEAEKKRRVEEALECYSCGEPIKYDKERPECYCNDCENMETVGKLTQAQERIKELELKHESEILVNFNKHKEIIQLQSENAVLVGALRRLLDSCERADAEEELSEYVDGSDLDFANKALTNSPNSKAYAEAVDALVFQAEQLTRQIEAEGGHGLTVHDFCGYLKGAVTQLNKARGM